MPTCPNCGTDNPDGFRFCGQCGTPLTQTVPERRKTVTLLFCDVSGSTALGERLEAESMREVMLRYFDEMRLVSVLGEPGIGKSRLAVEFLGSVETEARVLTGRCLSYGEGITYWALGEIVRQAAGIEKEDDAATARRRIESLLAGTEDAEVVAALIAQALGLERGSGATGEIAWAARRLFEALARERPLVVAIEDLHWAEQALVDLVEQLPALARGPILVVCLGRPEALDARPEWPGRVIRLEPLPDEDATLLIERLIGGAGLREDARERILEAAAGVPLFVEELLAILVEDGLVRQTPDGRWVPHGSLADFAIPPTIDALLAERLDRLEARQRTLLEDGAVEGQLFHLGAVLALAAESADRAARLLAELVQRELVHAERAGDRQWRDQILGLLGISALTGPDPVEEALERCAELVERARGARGAAALVNAYAASLEAMRGQFDAGREKAERSHSMLQDLGRRVTAAGACYFAAEVELLAGEPARAEEIARSAFDTLNALGETVNSAVVAAVLAEALVRQGRFDEAEALTETSERTAWPDDLHAQVGWRATRAQAVSGRGDAAGGERLAREALAMLDGADDLDLRGDALVALATTLAGPEREAAYREALGLYEAKGNLASADRVRGLLT